MTALKDDVAVVPEDEDAPPRLYVHIVNVYNAMLKTAKEREDGALIWEGKLTNFLEEEVGIAQSQYSRVMHLLKSMQCIIRLRRGSGAVPAQWAIIGPPTLDSYEHHRKQEGYRREKRIDPRDQRIKGLERELAVQVARIDRIVIHLGIQESKEQFDDMFREVDAKAAEKEGDEDGTTEPE